MKSAFLLPALAAMLFVAACRSNEQSANNAPNSNAVNTQMPGVAAPAANAANAANNAPAKSPDNTPKRVSFAKGSNSGSVSVTLPAGGAQRLIVGARSGQTMEVETLSKELQINLVKGRAETTEDFGFLHAELLATGDFVVEVRNPTKKEVKATVKFMVNGGDPKSDPTYEEPVVDEDEEKSEEAGKPSGERRND